MDLVLDVLDRHFLTPYVYPTSWPTHDILRQAISLFVILNIGGAALYLITATISYVFVFNHDLMKHPLFLQNQVRREIRYALGSIPYMSLLTMAVMLLEVRGYSRLHDTDSTASSLTSVLISIPSFICFTDMGIYWIHRLLHHKLVYPAIHKPHHWWKIPTPFASHAFHPLDGFLQSVPYHVYPFIFPTPKILYLLMFVVVNVWTVSIHDGDFRVPRLLRPLVNGSAHHSDHHLYYNYNYGQFFTLWDRIGGSFREPNMYGEKKQT